MFRRTIKSLFVFTILLSVCIVASPLFIPEHKYHTLVEELISEGIDREVKIAKLKYQLFPLPHIEGSNITILSDKHSGEAVIGHVSVWFNYGQLLARKPQIEHLHFNGIAANQAFFESFAQQQKLSSENNAPNHYINIKRISATSVSVRDNNNKLLPPFRFDGRFNNDNLFSNLTLSLVDHNLQATITPVTKKRFQVTLEGNHLSLPIDLPFPISSIRAQAFYEDHALEVTQFQIQANQSQLSGHATLENPNKKWLASGTINISDNTLSLFKHNIAPVDQSSHFNGKLNAKLNFASFSETLDGLANAAIIKGSFTLQEGHIAHNNTDFKFDMFQGKLLAEGNTIMFNDVYGQLYAGTVHANNIQIKDDSQWLISGEFTPKDINYHQLMYDLFKTSPLSGKATGSLSFFAKTKDTRSLINNLNIQGDLKFTTPAISFENDNNQTAHLDQLSSLEFNHFKLTPKSFTVKSLNMTGYEGTLHATDLNLNWQSQWALASHIETKNVALAPLIEQLHLEPFISGYLDSKHSIKASAPSFAEIFNYLEINGQFKLLNGIATLSTQPVYKYFKFKHAHGQAKFNKHQLVMPKLNVTAYDGKILARDLHLSNNENEWALFSQIESNEVELEPLLRDTTNQQIIAGKVNGKVTLALNGPQLDQLLNRMDARGSFFIHDGIVYNTDIEQAVTLHSKQENKTDVTEFTGLSSKFEIVENQITLSKLRISSESLSGKGDVIISPDHQLSGSLDVAVKSTGNLLQVPLNVTGTVDDPQFTLTSGALVGSAVGTSVLGPGLGTFIGLHTGKLFTGIGNLFTRETN